MVFLHLRFSNFPTRESIAQLDTIMLRQCLDRNPQNPCFTNLRKVAGPVVLCE